MMEIQARKVTYTKDPTAYEVAHAILEKKPVGILQDEKRIRHVVLIQKIENSSAKGAMLVWEKLKGLLLFLWDTLREVLLRRPPPKIHVTDLRNLPDTALILKLFEKALQRAPNRGILQARELLLEHNSSGILKHIRGDFLQNDLSLKHKEAIVLGDFTRFFDDLSLTIGSKTLDAQSRKEKMLKTLQSLAESPDEKEMIQKMCDEIRAKFAQNIEENQAVTDALKKHAAELPKSLKYLLVAGSQTALASVALVVTSIIERDLVPLNLYLTASEERSLKVHVRPAKDGHFSSLRIEQELDLLINTTQIGKTPLRKGNTVLRVPIRMTTTISGQKKEVQIQCPKKPCVIADPSTPGYERYQEIVEQIADAFKNVSFTS